MKVAMDLDATLAEYTEWQGIDHIGQAIPHAVDTVNSLIDEGVEVIIHTTRMNTEVNPGYDIEELRELIEQWLVDNGFDSKVTIWDKPGKPLADVYVDDRAYRKKPNTAWTNWDLLLLLERLK